MKIFISIKFNKKNNLCVKIIQTLHNLKYQSFLKLLCQKLMRLVNFTYYVIWTNPSVNIDMFKTWKHL